MKRSVLMALIASMSGCASLGNFEDFTSTFTLESGNKIVVARRGCGILGATFINNSDKSISLVHGTLISIQKDTKATLEQYQLSCSPTLAGGSSKCMVSLLIKDTDSSKYGGLSCPNMGVRISGLMVK